MNTKQTKRYEMLLRLRGFGNTHRDLFAASPVAQETFASLNTAIDELATTDRLKMSAAARADRQTTTRKALSDLLVMASQLARVLRASGKSLPVLDLPESRSDQKLLSAARQFAEDSAPFEADFTGHGVGPKTIAEAAAAFEAALLDRGSKRAEYTAARTRIRDLLAAVVLDVRRLDLIVQTQLADNNPLLAVWKEARRVMSPRNRNGSAASAETPEPAAPVAPVEPPAIAAAAPADEAPKPTPVSETRSREAA